MLMNETLNSNVTPNYKPAFNNVNSPAQPVQAAPEAAIPQKVSASGHFYSKLDMAVMSFCMVGIITTGILEVSWLRWVIAIACILALPSPAIVQKVRERRRLSLRAIFDYFRKKGLNPVLNGDELRWESQGKMNIMRLANGCQLQVYREYPLQEEILGKFESAASVTMDEVFSAKVGVRRPEGDKGSIFFSTELFCTSVKELGLILPASVSILDTAEERQRVNLGEILSADSKPKRKIGFVQGNL